MNPQQIQLWINVIAAAIEIGEPLVRTIRSYMANRGMTDEQINELEAAAVAESERRKAVRESMTGEGGGL